MSLSREFETLKYITKYVRAIVIVIGPILDERLKEIPERMSSVFTFMSVCLYELQSTPFDIGIKILGRSLGHEKETPFWDDP